MPKAAARRRARPETPRKPAPRAALRRQMIITEAARQFSARGFEGTSMRDIATASGLLAGSLYYHFDSKEALFIAVHGAGMDMIDKSVRAALEGITDPWQRLEAMAVAHCDALLSLTDMRAIVTPHASPAMKHIRPALVAQRDRYEKLVKELVDRLELPPDVPPALFRLHFLGALNWAPTWFDANRGFSPSQIGRLLVRMLRDGCGAALSGSTIAATSDASTVSVAAPKLRSPGRISRPGARNRRVVAA